MGELRRHFRDRTWTVYVPRRAKDMRNAVGSATDDLRADLHRTPLAAEIADRLAITTGLVNEVQQANNARYATTLDRAGRKRDEPGDGFDAMLDRTVLVALLAHLAPASVVSSNCASSTSSAKRRSLSASAPVRCTSVASSLPAWLRCVCSPMSSTTTGERHESTGAAGSGVCRRPPLDTSLHRRLQ